jgi:hypothetical protein
MANLPVRARPDISSKVVHLVKGESAQAIQVLLDILDSRALLGGTGKIKGGYKCVCFTESPIAQLVLSLSDPERQHFKYRPIGVMFDKAWVFKRGARPAIYQTEAEYLDLPEKMRYRHVLYEPHKCDFTWEREWRLLADALPFSPEDVTVIVPSRRWANALIDVHFDKAGESAAMERFPWHIIALSDLGIYVP